MAFDKYSPVQPLKIELIQNLLNDPKVNELYTKWLKFNVHGICLDSKLFKEREKAFKQYADARDEFLGLTPVKIPVVTGFHKE